VTRMYALFLVCYQLPYDPPELVSLLVAHPKITYCFWRDVKHLSNKQNLLCWRVFFFTFHFADQISEASQNTRAENCVELCYIFLTLTIICYSLGQYRNQTECSYFVHIFFIWSKIMFYFASLNYLSASAAAVFWDNDSFFI